MSKAKAVAVTNQKGGVGKTTVAAHLAFALNALDKRVLVVDLDIQGNISSILSRDPRVNTKPGGSELIFEGREGLKGQPTPTGIDLLHGHSFLEKIDAEVVTADTIPLRDYVRNLDYDYIIFDTPPALGVRQLAPILWAHHLVIPTEPTPLSVSGLASTIRVAQKLIESKQNANLRWKIVVNKLIARSNEQETLKEKIKMQFPKNFALTFAHRVGLVDCLARGVPVWEYKGIPKEVGEAWRSLPSALGII